MSTVSNTTGETAISERDSTDDPSKHNQRPVRLENYPQRLRARVAGRVVQVRLSAPTTPALYEAVLEVEKSRPLSPISIHALSGIPVVEVIGDDLDDQQEVAAETDDNDTEDSDNRVEDSQSFPQYRVHRHRVKPAPLYPDYPPVTSGHLVRLIWHGQRTVPGVVAGTYLRCSGMLSTAGQIAQIYNPRYEIVPLPATAKK